MTALAAKLLARGFDAIHRRAREIATELRRLNSLGVVQDDALSRADRSRQVRGYLEKSHSNRERCC